MRSLGASGEDLAVKFLKKKGYRIIERNHKTPLGEIDIIAQDGVMTVFVEVKTRAGTAFGHPFESVHEKKRQKLRKLALLYLKKQPAETPARFDVLSIVLKGDSTYEVEHIKDAFEA
ncbi:MAG: YraN family protein [Nitrospirota bacterium]